MNYFFLVIFLLSLGSTAHSQLSSTSDREEELGEQCELGTQDVPGHALLASKMVRTISRGVTDLEDGAFPEELPLSEKAKQPMDMTKTNGYAHRFDQAWASANAIQPPQHVPDPAGAAAAADKDEATRTDVADEWRHRTLEYKNPQSATPHVPDPAGAAAAADKDEAARTDVADEWRQRTLEHKNPQSGPANVSIMPDTHEPTEKKHVLALYVVVPIASVFFALFTISNVMEKFKITCIPESGIMIAIGVVLGTVWKMYAHFDFFEDADAFGEMNSAILNLVFLPIIIFASGWSIRRQDFFSQFPYILLFAGVGVGLSIIVIACLIFWSGYMELHGVTRWRTAFAYASLISATDPVATLSTYTQLKVDPLLNIMVFGESILNDAVAIVVFNIFNSDEYMLDSKGEPVSFPAFLGNLIYGVLKIFGGSAVLGTGLGAIYTLIAHWADMRHSKKGLVLSIFAACYLTYALAESLAMSGIIAEMFCALLMGIYMRDILSTEGSVLATFFVKQVAALADAAVCLLIGVSVVQLTSEGWYFGLWVMLFCLIGRFFSVVPVALVTNVIKTVVGKTQNIPEEGWNLLTPQHVFMMWHAGLRGAIALALALELGHWVDVIDGPGTRRSLQTATFFLICTFLLLFGGSTSFMLHSLGVETGKDYPADHLAKFVASGPLRDILKWLDRNIFSPILLGHKQDRDEDEDEVDVEELLKKYGRA